MVLFLRSGFGALLMTFLLIGLLESLTVDARSHGHHHLSRRGTETADSQPQDNKVDDDYEADAAYDGDDFLNDGDGDDGEDDEDEDDDLESSDDIQGPSVVTSKSTNFTVPEGGTVWLPCDVTNGQNAVIIWKKGDQSLYQGDMRITTDNRIFKYTNYTISVTKLRASDYSTYTCTVIEGQGTTVLTHVVSKPSPAKVLRVLPEGHARQVPEGQSLRVECRASGDPEPNITWSRKGQRLTKDDVEIGRQYVFIKSVKRQDSGMYQCLVSNGVGQPAHGAVDIKILHAPEVHVRKSVVNTDEGYEAQMLCSVKSEPRATIMWERNGEVLKDSHHHHIALDTNGHHSTLRILKVTPSDFGKYECKANNEYGEGEGHVNLVRHPGRALWITGSQEQADSSPVLQWAVESVQPITDVELRYYKVDESKPERTANEEEWIIVRPEITEPEGNMYTLKHALHGLRPGKYAARLRAKNTHGWSDLSDQHTFDGDYETNEVNERLEEAPMAEVGSSAINNRISTAASLLLSLLTYNLVRII